MIFQKLCVLMVLLVTLSGCAHASHKAYFTKGPNGLVYFENERGDGQLLVPNPPPYQERRIVHPGEYDPACNCNH